MGVAGAEVEPQTDRLAEQRTDSEEEEAPAAVGSIM